jgi:hypothetical protein
MAEEKDWTIMIYMAGDNNLSTDMSYALEQIKSVTKETDKVNLFVSFDGFSLEVPTIYCDFTEKNQDTPNYYRSFKITDKLISSKEKVEQNFNENSASINSVLNFVDWCVNKVEHKITDGTTVKGRKANNYAMIFSGHSFGFQGQGLFKDEKANDTMSLDELKLMFERITMTGDELEKAKVQNSKLGTDELGGTTEILGKKLAILGFDSCVMSMMEIGCQFREVAETMVASEGSIPNAGWSYAQVLGTLTKAGNISPKHVAADFVQEFIKQQSKFSLADISVDMAAWDLSVLKDVETSFKSFVEKLNDCFVDVDSVTYKQMRRILIQAHWQCQTYLFEQNIDLGDFCGLLKKEIESLKTELGALHPQTITDLGESCENLIDEIRKCVLITGFSGSNYQFSTGISLYFPWSLTSYEASMEDYEKLTFVNSNPAGEVWNKFLKNYLGKISLRQARTLTKQKDGSMVKTEVDSVVYRSYEYSDELLDNTSNTSTTLNETRVPINGSNRVPINGTNKLFNALSSLLSRFMELKNVNTFWNHTGFTSKFADFSLESKAEPVLPPVSASVPTVSASVPTVSAPVPTFPPFRFNVPIPPGNRVNRITDDQVASSSEIIKANLDKVVLDKILLPLHDDKITDLLNPLPVKTLEKLNDLSLDGKLKTLTKSTLDMKTNPIS